MRLVADRVDSHERAIAALHWMYCHKFYKTSSFGGCAASHPGSTLLLLRKRTIGELRFMGIQGDCPDRLLQNEEDELTC